jgi:hypothetical protein
MMGMSNTSAETGADSTGSNSIGPQPAAAPWRFSNVSIHTLEHIDAPIGERAYMSQQIAAAFLLLLLTD